MKDRRPLAIAARVISALAAVASLVPAWYAAAIATLSIAVSAKRPDPRVPDGEPCCGHPDTWGEVVEGLLFGVASVVALGAMLLIAGTLVRFSLTGRRPSPRPVRRVSIAGALVAVWALVLFGVLGI